MEWQLIETAPKDGTSVLVHDDGAVFVAAWAAESEEWGTDGWFDDAGRLVVPAPTHWMPLPEPPRAS